ncbi:MAG: hypothetical protein NZ922_03405 [Candidatus Methanomethyliaceae archaeon]|nr:hypothetical protein [Candidatus Methanomethyliaceae archaeon]MDW7970516.1 hypothetical protein [Nitrososphaerota archaeon]
MKVVKFKINGEYNIDFTLKPSFVSSLYKREEKYYWIKHIGLNARAIFLKQVNDYLKVFMSCEIDHEIILYESGLWDDKPSSRISKLSGSLKEQIKALSEIFPGVRISIAPHDFNCIFIASVLSKRANYEMVRRWMKDLWEKWKCNIEVIAKLSEIKGSYQLMDLIKTMRDYLKLSNKSNDVNELRRMLMLCWGVGPKVADATLLFTTKSPWIVPCDIHLYKISKRLGWIDCDVRLPKKALCLKYWCEECINKYGPCLREAISELFPSFGGWIQTLTYLFGSSICKTYKPKCYLCHSILREYCRAKSLKEKFLKEKF